MTDHADGLTRLQAPHRVHLDHFDIALCNTQAARVRAVHEARRTPVEPHLLLPRAPLNPFGAHFVGCLGEIAVGRFLRRPPRWTIEPVTDSGTDFDLPNGRKGQVKAYTFGGKTFEVVISDLKKLMAADVLVATHIVNPVCVDVLGWIPCERFRALAVVKDFGYGAKYALRPGLLERDFTAIAAPAHAGGLQ